MDQEKADVLLWGTEAWRKAKTEIMGSLENIALFGNDRADAYKFEDLEERIKL